MQKGEDKVDAREAAGGAGRARGQPRTVLVPELPPGQGVLGGCCLLPCGGAQPLTLLLGPALGALWGRRRRWHQGVPPCLGVPRGPRRGSLGGCVPGFHRSHPLEAPPGLRDRRVRGPGPLPGSWGKDREGLDGPGGGGPGGGRLPAGRGGAVSQHLRAVPLSPAARRRQRSAAPSRPVQHRHRAMGRQRGSAGPLCFPLLLLLLQVGGRRCDEAAPCQPGFAAETFTFTVPRDGVAAGEVLGQGRVLQGRWGPTGVGMQPHNPLPGGNGAGGVPVGLGSVRGEVAQGRGRRDGCPGWQTRHKAVAVWGRGRAYVSVHREELGRCRCRGRQHQGEGVRGQRAPLPAALTQAQTCRGRQAWVWGAEPDRHAWPPHGLAVPLRGAPSTRLDVEPRTGGGGSGGAEGVAVKLGC
ncbi:Cadherin-1 isoform X1 [Aix galericulata]|nr:Cadherin-1 isoform X1 [Aix galericulata]